MKQLDVGYNSLRLSEGEKKIKIIVTLLRIIVFLATLSATIVMALNKETKTLVVATIGTTSVKATIAAKFQHTPANIFFVVGNGLAALHSLLALHAEFFGRKLDPKGVRFMVISILDILLIHRSKR
ncbi:CASP-like protein 1B2 [Amaranthus tricolor]|uniref:CASP-like protein 1B2 n=1 Tax=Amaranthus tricolor TaxID=29722 RepID=UPI00258DBE41|nr:CASP-like protein 1B2 [Amaranthus tricolor]